MFILTSKYWFCCKFNLNCIAAETLVWIFIKFSGVCFGFVSIKFGRFNGLLIGFCNLGRYFIIKLKLDRYISYCICFAVSFFIFINLHKLMWLEKTVMGYLALFK